MSDGPYMSANGSRVVSLDLLFPYIGAPVADVGLAAGDLLTNPVILRVGNLAVKMALARRPDGSVAQASFAGSTNARLVGGAGTWRNTVTLTPYNRPAGVLLSAVLGDLAMATGTTAATRERVNLAKGLDRSLGLRYVPGVARPASFLLASLSGPLWWIDAAGVTQIATTRPAITIATPASVAELNGAKGWVSVATEDLAAWQPGARYVSATIPNGITVAASRMHAGSDGVLRVEVLVQ